MPPRRKNRAQQQTQPPTEPAEPQTPLEAISTRKRARANTNGVSNTRAAKKNQIDTYSSTDNAPDAPDAPDPAPVTSQPLSDIVLEDTPAPTPDTSAVPPPAPRAYNTRQKMCNTAQVSTLALHRSR